MILTGWSAANRGSGSLFCLHVRRRIRLPGAIGLMARQATASSYRALSDQFISVILPVKIIAVSGKPAESSSDQIERHQIENLSKTGSISGTLPHKEMPDTTALNLFSVSIKRTLIRLSSQRASKQPSTAPGCARIAAIIRELAPGSPGQWPVTCQNALQEDTLPVCIRMSLTQASVNLIIGLKANKPLWVRYKVPNS
jgi:hypothetical protein